MQKVNLAEIAEDSWSSPKGKFSGSAKAVSEALGRQPQSTDLVERHPFDLEILRIAPGHIPYPYHSHAAQWNSITSCLVAARSDIKTARPQSPPATPLSFVLMSRIN